MKRLLLAVVMLLLIIILPVLGGSMIWVMSGSDSLDIDGTAAVVAGSDPGGSTGWPHYGGDTLGRRYSAASQITPDNVTGLEIAWQYRTGDLEARGDLMRRTASEGTPILVDDKLIFCTPFNEVIAIDPGTGEERWRYDPKINLDQRPANQFVCRGVVQWELHHEMVNRGDCPKRIFVATNDARLIALKTETGELCREFGNDGEVRIDPGMELRWPGEFQVTSPPVISQNTIVVGSSISDNARVAAPAGTVRAFDARTGEPRWSFDPIPRDPGDAASSTWQGQTPPSEGHANVWAPMSVDENLDLVFLPTSSPSPDFYGGLRPGNNRHANSVVALDPTFGKPWWTFQTVYHDVWDYDLPSQPGLYTVTRDGEQHEVVAQVTKTGMLFVLERRLGEPFLPVEIRPVPQDGAVPGEALSPVQPFPVATPLIVPDRIEPKDAFGVTWFDKRECRKRIKESVANGLYTPPTEQGTLIYPFTGGGANWGGTAYDPSRNLLVVNMSNLIHHVQLIPADKFEDAREVYHDQEVSPQTGAPYGMKRETLLSPLGLPCNPPPWGIIAGIDLATGAIVWRKTLGTTEDLGGGPPVKLGTPNFGGPIITASGLVFIGAAMDDYLRAFDVSNGEELWRGRLPAGGQATPMTYEWQGRQYVVIYAGGHARAGTRLGDSIVAFALPE